MRDIVADNFISFISANNIPHKNENGFVIIQVKQREKVMELFYFNKRFYIDKKDYVGQPHIILHWNPKNELNDKNFEKYGLCLTMNGSDRRNNELTQNGQLERAKEIVFEMWKDPIEERFEEINATFQTRLSKDFYIDHNGVVTNIKTEEKYNSIKVIDIIFTGQTKSEILNLVQSLEHNSWVLTKINHKGKIKKILISPKQDMLKLNDFTNESFWGRVEKEGEDQKIAIVIGLGSVGGLVLDFLCKSHFKKIIIYDDDDFDVVNNPRHVLGIKSKEIGLNKSKHLAEHYSQLFPMIKIEVVDKKFQYNSTIPDNSLVFNTTGGSHETLAWNSLSLYTSNKGKKFSFVDIFVEPFALAIHCIVFKNSKEQEKSDWSFEYLNDERYLVTPEKDFRKNFDGCFAPTLTYGFSPLQIAIPWIMIKMKKSNYKGCHYTIPFLSFFPDKKKILNKNLANSINPYKIGVKIWKK